MIDTLIKLKYQILIVLATIGIIVFLWFRIEYLNEELGKAKLANKTLNESITLIKEDIEDTNLKIENNLEQQQQINRTLRSLRNAQNRDREAMVQWFNSVNENGVSTIEDSLENNPDKIEQQINTGIDSMLSRVRQINEN